MSLKFAVLEKKDAFYKKLKSLEHTSPIKQINNSGGLIKNNTLVHHQNQDKYTFEN